jgi:primosomal protein N' (replication factor Y)
VSAATPSCPILRVALDTPVRRLFDYVAPAGAAAVAPGLRVAVPFGRQRKTGVIIEVASHSTVQPERLRAATAVLDAQPALDPAAHALVLFAADYYQHPLGEAYAAALPAALRTGTPLASSTRCYRLAEGAKLPNRAGTRQRAVFGSLSEHGPLDDAELNRRAPGGRAALRALLEHGLAVSFTVPQAPPLPPVTNLATAGPPLSAAQSAAVAVLTAGLGGFLPVLLDGVTGSGKTEVYLELIARALAAGRQALVLVPEIGLTPQTVARFAERLAVPIALLHSGLTDATRLDMWRAVRSGAARVAIGTRSAVFAPLPDLGVIVVDEEHDASYKQQEGFRYSARDLAVWRAQQAGIPVVLGSATPSLETLHNVNEGRYRRLDLPERAGHARAPRIATVDLRIHAASGALATPAVLAMERHLGAGGQVLLYLNRRGFAPTLFCPGCAWVAPCASCDARLTVHLREQRLVCHHCGASTPLPFACPRCATELKPVGQGTERVEETLDRLFPGVPVVRIDRDTVRRRGEMEEALARVRSGSARILVGTQMLTKGHDFPDVSLVVVLDADQGLFGTDFRCSERLAQSITQVAGRAGRAERPGEVLVQSACPEHPLLVRLLGEGYDAFARAALEERAAAGFPPYSRLALLAAEAGAAAVPMRFLIAAREAAGTPAQVRLLGPAPAVLERRAGRWRAQLLLEARQRAPLKRLLESWLPRLDALPDSRRVRWSLDVDPLEVG